MKIINLGTESEEFKENLRKALVEFYDESIIEVENDSNIIFKIPFSDNYYSRMRYDKTTVKIGLKDSISGTNIVTDFLFSKSNSYTQFTLLILKNNSITLFEGDSSTIHGGTSLYSIANTDKGLIFFSYCEARQDMIEDSKSVCIETGKDLVPVMFGNQYISKDNEVFKQPLKFTDTDGVIYTCKDIYNISYRPESFISLPMSFISNIGGANKTHPREKFNTSILIYDEEN